MLLWCACSELNDRFLDGTIPATLGSLSDLVILDLSGNFLTGQIPASLGSLSNLHSLILDSNALTGSVPASLGSLSNLYELYVRTIFFKYLSVGHVQICLYKYYQECEFC